MPTVYINDGDVIRASVTVEQLEEVQPVTIIPVLLPDSDRADWLASYDPSNQYSANATDSRRCNRLNRVRPWQVFGRQVLFLFSMVSDTSNLYATQL